MVIVEAGRTESNKDYPEWALSIAISDDQEILIPIQWCGDDAMALLLLAMDETNIYIESNITYAPIEWVRKTFPCSELTCDKIEKYVKDYVFGRN